MDNWIIKKKSHKFLVFARDLPNPTFIKQKLFLRPEPKQSLMPLCLLVTYLYTKSNLLSSITPSSFFSFKQNQQISTLFYIIYFTVKVINFVE